MKLDKEETLNLVRLLFNKDYISTAVEMLPGVDYKTFVEEMIIQGSFLKYKGHRICLVFYKERSKQLMFYVNKSTDIRNFQYAWYDTVKNRGIKESVKFYRSGSIELMSINKVTVLKKLQRFLRDIIEKIDEGEEE